MSSTSTHLSTKEPSQVLAVLYFPDCVTDKCRATTKTYLMESKNIIPMESLLGLLSIGIPVSMFIPYLTI